MNSRPPLKNARRRPTTSFVATLAAVPVHRYLWLSAGWACFAVGVIGVALPGLPTTGPMLLALACFAKGSPRLHDWLMSHRVFGPPLQRWKKHRTIPLRAKVLAVSMMLASFAFVALWSSLPSWLVAPIGGLIAVGLVVVLRLPHDGRER